METREGERERLRLILRGAVQGIGFRPFVYRLARVLDLAGWVENSTEGVAIEVEGERARIAEFRWRLRAEGPPRTVIRGLEVAALPPVGDTCFEIRTSEVAGRRTAFIVSDAATCGACLGELVDPKDRRYRHAFANCTACGPRYSIILGLPYDRERTTMAAFTMCPGCRSEYEDPGNRRFHAEPNACPECGPHLELWKPDGTVLQTRDDALVAAAAAVRDGQIVAIKGIGGFQLIVDARSEEGVKRLRRRKHREAKPFAVMVRSLQEASAEAEVGALEAQVLASPEAPILLLSPRRGRIAASVAPHSPTLGLMLPTTALHHLLLADLDFPIVATSGNVSDEPICTDEHEALARLGEIADLFLVHDRPIARPVDDSVARVVGGRLMLLRRARGYAPFPIGSHTDLPSILAVGGHLKNTVAVSVGRDVFLSPHVGDLDTTAAFDSFQETVSTLLSLHDIHPDTIACDGHPDYRSTQFAEGAGMRVVRVQHHYAHVLALMADQEIPPPVLGFAWDGSGYGFDGTVWGGESLLVNAQGFDRVARLRPFLLPGGDAAVRQPRRSALGLLHAILGTSAWDHAVWQRRAFFSAGERRVLEGMLAGGINSPETSSVGRLFDGVAALVGLGGRCTFEGQAAMALEAALRGFFQDESYPFTLEPHEKTLELNWEPMVRGIVEDVMRGEEPGRVSLRFHNTLAEMIVGVAEHFGEERIGLTGGCFQNRYLTERAVIRLRQAGFAPHWHERLPPGDGGIAVGQVLGAAREVGRG
jgi:hydrogenase maturation protein HypF